MSYDSWLESPYTARAERGEVFERFCEDSNIDPEDPEADGLFESWVENREEDIALQKAEARAERDQERWDNYERSL